MTVGEETVISSAAEVVEKAEEDRLDRNDHMTHLSVTSVDDMDIGTKTVLKLDNMTTKHLFLHLTEGRRRRGSRRQSQTSLHNTHMTWDRVSSSFNLTMTK